ncbi:MAG TPA: hypothetical protein VF480_11360 [Verrucomicrobiae bacterium]
MRNPDGGAGGLLAAAVVIYLDGFIRAEIFGKRANSFSTGVDTARGKPQFRNMAFDREQMKKKAAALAAKGVYVGTSSWKYEGWFEGNALETIETMLAGAG